MFDFVIIGGGPGGYRSAELLKKEGFTVALIEENRIGGTCLNEGCIPFKSYLHSARIKTDTEKMMRCGNISEAEVYFDQRKMLQNKEQILKNLRQGLCDMLCTIGVELFWGTAKLVSSKTEVYKFAVGDMVIEAKRVVIATGSENRAFLTESDNDSKCTIINSSTMLELTDLPPRIDIIGGGVIGIEAATFFSECGSKVTLIEASSKIGGHIDNDISEAICRILQKRGIEIIKNAMNTRIEREGVVFQQNEQLIKRKPEYVMLATGRKPRLDKGMLIGLGVDYTDTGIVIDEYCKTSNPNVYACGDVTGKLMLAHVAYHQARVIADNAKGSVTTVNYFPIPRVIYSNPEILSVGYTEEDCKEHGIAYEAKTLPMTYSGKYFAENGKDGAKAKMIVDSEKRIIGFHMLGNGASELSMAIEMMINQHMTCHTILSLVFPHPTYCEIIADLAGGLA